MEFIDLKAQYKEYKKELDTAVQDVLDSAAFIGGYHVDKLEKELAEYIGVKHCISCGNGTDALQLIYMAIGIGAGDAVFCPDMTFVASIEPAVMLGAEPVFCDIDPVSYNLDPLKLEAQVIKVLKEGRLSPKAVVAVDFLGNPADYNSIQKICDKYNLVLVEDAAQGTGGIYNGRKLGSFGDLAATSFFPSKPLGCYGDGGAVFTNSDELSSLIRSIKVHGKGVSKYDNIRVGVNSRLDNIQAAILNVKLDHLEYEMNLRQTIAEIYNQSLNDILSIPKIEDGCRSAYAQYVVLAESKEQRSAFLDRLEAENIPSLIYYPKCMHKMDAFKGCAHDECKTSEHYASTNFGLPFSAFLHPTDAEKIIKAIRQCD